MRVHQIDPLKDPRWQEFVQKHPRGSVFHSTAWLQTLRNTYGYTPIVYTTSSSSAELKNGLVFCLIRSWLTGNRLVSLPFSDHCELLTDTDDSLRALLQFLKNSMQKEAWRYVEVRSVKQQFALSDKLFGFRSEETYLMHVLDLSPELERIFAGLDKDCVQRRVQRAERSGLIEKCGRSDLLLEDFYRLFLITRRRHGLPPIPYAWFQNLIWYLGEDVEIRVAYTNETPISSILTLKFKDTVYYKYGCSDARFKMLGATPWLLWRAIRSARLEGARKFDMGRSESENLGLITFKNHWVSESQPLVYWRSPGHRPPSGMNGWKLRMAKRLFSHMPSAISEMTANLIYRHFG